MNIIVGYCRISTPKQNIERQVRNILQCCPEAQIIKETYTGTKSDRPEWNRILKAAERGDIKKIIFDSVSRISRNASEGIETYFHLYQLGVQLEFIKEPQINTEVYKSAMNNILAVHPESGDRDADELIEGIGAAVNRYMQTLAHRQIELAFQQAEKEVRDLHQRTSEGMKTAKLHGKQIGQRQGAHLRVKKEPAAKRLIQKHSRTFGGTLKDSEVIKLCGISRNTYYKYKKQMIVDMHSVPSE